MEAATLAPLTDVHGRVRSPVTHPGHGAGKPPKSKGRKYAPQAFTMIELQALLSHCVPTSKHAGRHARHAGYRLRAACVLMYRTGLRVQEALDLEERDLDRGERLITVRCGKGGKRRVVGMDAWGWSELDSWMRLREEYPVGPLFPTLMPGFEGRPWDQSDLRRALRVAAKRANLRRRANPHAFRHSFAVHSWREGIDVLTIQRQLGHSRLDVTQAYLVSLGADDLLTPVTERPAPMVPLSL